MSFQISASGIQIVVLELGDEFYGIEIGHIQEIVRPQPTRSVPDAPALINGITSLRGSILPVLDLRRRLGAKVTATTSQTRLVVTDIGAETVALVVDGVSEILSIVPEEIDVPDELTAGEPGLVLGVAKTDGRLIVVIDPFVLMPTRPAQLKASA